MWPNHEIRRERPTALQTIRKNERQREFRARNAVVADTVTSYSFDAHHVLHALIGSDFVNTNLANMSKLHQIHAL